jgi:hypothetical protein
MDVAPILLIAIKSSIVLTVLGLGPAEAATSIIDFADRSVTNGRREHVRSTNPKLC